MTIQHVYRMKLVFALLTLTTSLAVKVKPIDRIPLAELDEISFYEDYVKPKLPVVLTAQNKDGSLPEAWKTLMSWDVNYLKKKCRSANVPVKQHEWGHKKAKDAQTWASHVYKGTWKLDKYFNEAESDPRLYLFGMDIKCECPALLDDIVVPFPFAQAWTNSIAYDVDVYPTLIVGSNKTQSSLHMDNARTPSYMTVVQGQKQMRIVTAVDGDQSLDSYFGPFNTGEPPFAQPENIFDDGLFRMPPMHKIDTVYDTTLGPGDTIYIPHAFQAERNVGDDMVIAVSASFWDESHFPVLHGVCQFRRDVFKQPLSPVCSFVRMAQFMKERVLTEQHQPNILDGNVVNYWDMIQPTIAADNGKAEWCIRMSKACVNREPDDSGRPPSVMAPNVQDYCGIRETQGNQALVEKLVPLAAKKNPFCCNHAAGLLWRQIRMLADGDKTKKPIQEQVLGYLKVAAEAGDAQAADTLAFMYDSEGETERAKFWLNITNELMDAYGTVPDEFRPETKPVATEEE